jgi:hypothetical protein
MDDNKCSLLAPHTTAAFRMHTAANQGDGDRLLDVDARPWMRFLPFPWADGAGSSCQLPPMTRWSGLSVGLEERCAAIAPLLHLADPFTARHSAVGLDQAHRGRHKACRRA